MNVIKKHLGAALGVITSAKNQIRSLRESEDGRRSDRRGAREERVERTGDHLDSDWAGREILGNYLIGGDDRVIVNNPKWSEYMKDNHILSNELDLRAVADAQQLFNMDGDQTIRIDENFPIAIENGESIIGYEYLHGTNGGFGRTGNISIVRNADGTSTVNLDMQYAWNDVIDPNGQYQTDTIKSRIAEIATLGKADPYDIQINWAESTTVILDEDGNVKEIIRDTDPTANSTIGGNSNNDPSIEITRTESTRDVDATSSPITNVTTATNSDGTTTTTTTTVTSPTGVTYEASNNG